MAVLKNHCRCDSSFCAQVNLRKIELGARQTGRGWSPHRSVTCSHATKGELSPSEDKSDFSNFLFRHVRLRNAANLTWEELTQHENDRVDSCGVATGSELFTVVEDEPLVRMDIIEELVVSRCMKQAMHAKPSSSWMKRQTSASSLRTSTCLEAWTD